MEVNDFIFNLSEYYIKISRTKEHDFSSISFIYNDNLQNLGNCGFSVLQKYMLLVISFSEPTSTFLSSFLSDNYD